MKAFFTEKLLPAVETILLGDVDAHGTALHSLLWYQQEIEAAQRMNAVLWKPFTVFNIVSVSQDYAQNVSGLLDFIQKRTAWLKEGGSRQLAGGERATGDPHPADRAVWQRKGCSR